MGKNKKKMGKNKKKIHVEDLTEDAWDWWNQSSQADPYMQERVIIALYMKENNIKEDDVDW